MYDRYNRRVEKAAWINIIHACHNENHAAYQFYGAKGVIVADEFRCRETGYAAFLQEVGLRPAKEYRISRKDTSLGFIPGNVEWRLRPPGFAGKLIEIDGVWKTLREWSKSSGIPIDTLRSRLARGKEGRALIAPQYSMARSDKGKPRK